MFSRDLGADHEDVEVTVSAPASLPSRPLEDIELSVSDESTESVQLRSGEVVLVDVESDKSSKSSENDRKLTAETDVGNIVVADSKEDHQNDMHVQFRADEAEIKSRISGFKEENVEVKLREEEKSQTSCNVM